MRRVALSSLLLCSFACGAQDAPLRLQSPDGKASVELTIDAQGQAVYAVRFNGEPVLLPSPLGV